MTNTEENKDIIQPEQAPAALADMPGVSDQARNTLRTITAGGYTPSAAVNEALGELNSVIARQPGQFRSGYYKELSGVMNDILGRKKFSYSIADDPMYKLYRQSYQSAGRRAMEDAMGQAAALTGGYGSSYSAAAGQQAYNRQLSALNDRIPELYRLSRDAYDAEGEALKQQYDMLNDAYQKEYGAYQDEFDRWLSERSAAQQRYDTELSGDLSLYADELERQAAQQKLEMQQAEADREYFYNMAMDMLDMGRTPSANILRSAGFSEEDIAALTAKKKTSSAKKTSASGKTAAAGQSLKEKYKAAKKAK